MRGGTSRGPFFLASDLPSAGAERDAVLIAAMGAGHELQVDGVGGGHPLTSKAAIIGPSSILGADVDYLFAQVRVGDGLVDMTPNCGNMLAAVAPFAIEAGLVKAGPGSTRVRIHNVNTGKLIEARLATPDGLVSYDGDTAIDGVPGTAAAIHLAFLDAAGAKTGSLFPTGARRDRIDGVDVTCIDAAMPLVIARAADLGKTGNEVPSALDADRGFMQRLERIRIEAGERMGMGRVRDTVIPKPVLLAPPARGGAVAARYFMPHACHRALAVTGAVGIGMAAAVGVTIAAEIVGRFQLPCTLGIEHPSGRLDAHLEIEAGRPHPTVSIVRTARRIFEGTIFVRLPARAGR
jgi:2-methylaconitate cis-trans-isomerase PrpF